jgi:hypothetical protein
MAKASFASYHHADVSLGQQAARSAVGLIVTTLPRLPANMFVTIIEASLVPAAEG